MSDKQRADVALVERGLCESRTKAQASIMAGEVYVGTRRIDKASEIIKPEDDLHLKGQGSKYVSRGGLKLEKAIASFGAAVCSHMQHEGRPGPMIVFGIPDTFVQHGSRSQLLKYLGLTAEQMAQRILTELHERKKSNER